MKESPQDHIQISVPRDFLESIRVAAMDVPDLSTMTEEAEAYAAIGEALDTLSIPSQLRVAEMVKTRMNHRDIQASLLAMAKACRQVSEIVTAANP